MSYRQTVDEFIQRFGGLVEVDIDPLDETGYTSVCRGNATVGINVIEERAVLLLISPIMKIPTPASADLYAKLLELNYLTTSDAAFAISADQHLICLRALRGIEGLDFEEFVDLLDTVATTADEWAERLRAEYPSEPVGG